MFVQNPQSWDCSLSHRSKSTPSYNEEFPTFSPFFHMSSVIIFRFKWLTQQVKHIWEEAQASVFSLELAKDLVDAWDQKEHKHWSAKVNSSAEGIILYLRGPGTIISRLVQQTKLLISQKARLHGAYLQNWSTIATTAGADIYIGLTLWMCCAQLFLRRYEPQTTLDILIVEAGWKSTQQKHCGRKLSLPINRGPAMTFIKGIPTPFCPFSPFSTCPHSRIQLMWCVNKMNKLWKHLLWPDNHCYVSTEGHCCHQPASYKM